MFHFSTKLKKTFIKGVFASSSTKKGVFTSSSVKKANLNVEIRVYRYSFTIDTSLKCKIFLSYRAYSTITFLYSCTK